MLGGSAIMEAVAVQNFRNPLRDTPRSRRLSPRVFFKLVMSAISSLSACTYGTGITGRFGHQLIFEPGYGFGDIGSL